jgi:hypothetical protein
MRTRDKYIRERPDKRVLLLIPLQQAFTELNVSIKNAAFDNFKANTQILG